MPLISPDALRKLFGRKELTTFGQRATAALKLPAAEALWLRQVGLPKEAAPYLSFGGPEFQNFPTVDSYYGSRGLADERYRVIGTSGEGDPVALDLNKEGAVVQLTHDDHFKPVFINASVRKLATCLAAFKRLIVAAQAAVGVMAFADNNVPPALLDEFVRSIRAADSKALGTRAMWMQQIKSMRAGPW